MRIQAKHLTGQALQQKSSALGNYADRLEAAQQQWFAGRSSLNSLPAELKSQVLGGGELSVAELGITDPAGAAALLVQAGQALVQLVEAQAKAQAAGLQLVEDLKEPNGILDQVESLISGKESKGQGAPVSPRDVPPWVLPAGQGAGGLGFLPMTWEPEDRGPMINVPLPRDDGPSSTCRFRPRMVRFQGCIQASQQIHAIFSCPMVSRSATPVQGVTPISAKYLRRISKAYSNSSLQAGRPRLGAVTPVKDIACRAVAGWEGASTTVDSQQSTSISLASQSTRFT